MTLPNLGSVRFGNSLNPAYLADSGSLIWDWNFFLFVCSRISKPLQPVSHWSRTWLALCILHFAFLISFESYKFLLSRLSWPTIYRNKSEALARLRAYKGTFPKTREEREAAHIAAEKRVDQNLAAHKAYQDQQLRLHLVVLIGDLIDIAVDISTEKLRVETNRLNHLASVADYLKPVPPILSPLFPEFLFINSGRAGAYTIYLAHWDLDQPPPWILRNDPILDGHWDSESETESSKHGTSNHVWLAIW